MSGLPYDTNFRLKKHKLIYCGLDENYSNFTKEREKLNPLFLSSTAKDNKKSQSFMELL
jgi:hypothetical protein